MSLNTALYRTLLTFLRIFLLIFGLSAPTFGQQLHHLLGEILLVPHPDLSISQLEKDYETFHGTPTQLQVKPLGSLNHFKVWHLRFDHNQIHEFAFLNALQRDHRTMEVQWNHVLTNRAVPDDPLFENQWHLFNPGLPGSNNNAQTQFPEVWDFISGGTTLDGDTIVVAIIDDGTDVDHPDLAQTHWRNFQEIPGNGIDDDNNGHIDDYLGWNVSAGIDLVQYGAHGVQVAGVLGAQGNNGIGISGTNWNIKIMHVAGVSLSESELVEAYFYVGEWRQKFNQTQGQEGALVVATNTSLGIDEGNPNDAPIWCNLYNQLGGQGILSAVAASNNDVNVDEVGDLPTNCSSEYLISVTATDQQDKREFASYGPINVDIAAPGEEIWTTATGGNYEAVSGTSFATPQVAGLIGLLYATACDHINNLLLNAPSEAAAVIKDVILEGVDPVPGLQDEILSGGRINAWNSYQQLEQICANCPEASNVIATNIDESTTIIDWFIFGDVQTVDLQYRTPGNSWTTIDNVEPPYLLFDLESCTEHQFRIISICSTDEQSSDVYAFTSNGCCESPAITSIEETSPTSIELNWPPISDAVGYLVRYRPLGVSNWTVQSSPCNCAAIDNLFICEEYEIEVKTLCNSNVTDFGETSLYTTGGCSNCSILPYCPSNSVESMLEWIEAISFPDMNYEYVSGNDNGYAAHSDPVLPFVIGSSVEMILTPGYEFINYEEMIRVWIDANHDGDFSPNEMAYHSIEPTIGQTAFTLNVPANAEPGIVRMRVVMQWYDGWNLPEACGYYDYGETEDYCIELVSSCSNEYSPTSLQNGPTEMLLQWESPDYFQQHKLRYRLFNTTEWNDVQVEGAEWMLTNLQSCEDYEYQMAPICGDGPGNWSVPYFFTTDCGPSNASEQLPIADVRVWPNPFVSELNIQGLLEDQGTSIRAQLIQYNGQMIERWWITAQELEQGHQKSLPENLPSGVYWLELQQGNQRQTLPLVRP